MQNPERRKITLISDANADYRVRWNDKNGLVKKANTVPVVTDENAHEDAGTGSTELNYREMPKAGELRAQVTDEGVVLQAQQADGFPEVVMKQRNGRTICKIPNGEQLTLISDKGIDYLVRWNDKEGLVKKTNTVPVFADEEEDEEEEEDEGEEEEEEDD